MGATQLKTNAVTSAKVKDGSLTAKDFAAGTVFAGSAGPAGPAGATGAQGAAGPAGPAGPTASFADVITSQTLTVAAAPVVTTTFAAPFAGRLIVNASLDLLQRGAGQVESHCWIDVASGGTSLIPSPTVAYVDSSADNQDSMLPLTRGVVLPAAGTYVVSISCARTITSGTPESRLDAGAITGILTAT